jgi:hypothetical protein
MTFADFLPMPGNKVSSSSVDGILLSFFIFCAISISHFVLLAKFLTLLMKGYKVSGVALDSACISGKALNNFSDN